MEKTESFGKKIVLFVEGVLQVQGKLRKLPRPSGTIRFIADINPRFFNYPVTQSRFYIGRTLIIVLFEQGMKNSILQYNFKEKLKRMTVCNYFTHFLFPHMRCVIYTKLKN